MSGFPGKAALETQPFIRALTSAILKTISVERVFFPLMAAIASDRLTGTFAKRPVGNIFFKNLSMHITPKLAADKNEIGCFSILQGKCDF